MYPDVIVDEESARKEAGLPRSLVEPAWSKPGASLPAEQPGPHKAPEHGETSSGRRRYRGTKPHTSSLLTHAVVALTTDLPLVPGGASGSWSLVLRCLYVLGAHSKRGREPVGQVSLRRRQTAGKAVVDRRRVGRPRSPKNTEARGPPRRRVRPTSHHPWCDSTSLRQIQMKSSQKNSNHVWQITQIHRQVNRKKPRFLLQLERKCGNCFFTTINVE
jgi:hypothetical protein